MRYTHVRSSRAGLLIPYDASGTADMTPGRLVVIWPPIIEILFSFYKFLKFQKKSTTLKIDIKIRSSEPSQKLLQVDRD